MDQRVCTTVTEMLNDRGYNIDAISHLEEVNILNNVLIIYINNDKLGVQHVKNIEKYIDEHNKIVNILIYKNGITSFAKNALNELEKPIECFSYNELTYNVTKHKIVPKHVMMTSDQKKEFLKKFRVNEVNLPLIPSFDPVVRYYNAKPGTLFEITRPSNTSVFSLYYRIVK